MAEEDSRGGFALFGGNNWWIWIIIAVIIIFCLNPGIMGGYGYCKD